MEDIGKASGQVIEFGKNLLDLSEYVDASNVYTQIIPLGKADSKGNRVDIKLVNGGKNYLESATGIALFGKIQKSVIWDDVTNRNTLKANGQRMLDKAVEMAIKITLRAFDLHRINVDTDKIEFGDKVHVVSLPHEISSDFLCSKIVYHLASLENTEYTFGLEFESMTSNYASYKRTYQYKMSTTMDDVSNAQSSADDKRRVFTSQPYPPYDVGDLWVGDYTLADGTSLGSLKLNGNNFISTTEVTKEMFEDNLTEVTIEGGDTIEKHENMELVQISKMGEEWWFILRDIPAEELEQMALKAQLDYLSMMVDPEL